MTTRQKLFIIYTIIIMAAIFIFSSQPGTKSASVSEKVAVSVGITQTQPNAGASTKPLVAGLNLRKVAHVTLYFLLGIGAYGAIEIKSKYYIRVLLSGLLCCLYSFTDEFHQLFVDGRDGRLFDCKVDAIGYMSSILICFIISLIVNCIRRKKAVS